MVCRNGSFYVGHTRNVLERIRKHENNTGARHTKLLKPFRLVYVERLYSASTAVTRERQLKKWSRAKKIALIQGNIDELKKLSRSKH
ncbi:MAG: GIY-YIG nuclease family protein [Opitutaceae bacterium]